MKNVSTQTIVLNQGWNLISTNIVPTDSSITTLFTGLDVQEIKTMDAFWRKGQNNAFNLLQTITTGKGYLVNMNVGGSLKISGFPLTNLSLPVPNTGWQLLGCPYQTATLFSTAYSATNSQYIKNFIGFWTPTGTLNSITNFEPGKGYFLKGK